MTVFVLLLAAFSIWGVIATVAAVRADGYGTVPMRKGSADRFTR